MAVSDTIASWREQIESIIRELNELAKNYEFYTNKYVIEQNKLSSITNDIERGYVKYEMLNYQNKAKEYAAEFGRRKADYEMLYNEQMNKCDHRYNAVMDELKIMLKNDPTNPRVFDLMIVTETLTDHQTWLRDNRYSRVIPCDAGSNYEPGEE